MMSYADHLQHLRVRELQPDYVVIEELRDGITGGIVLSTSFQKATVDSKWGCKILEAYNSVSDTIIAIHPDEGFAKVGITSPASDARIQITMKRTVL